MSLPASAAERPDVPAPVSPTVWRVQIAIAALAFALIGINDGALGVLLPVLSATYDVERSEIARLLLSSAAGYLITASLGAWIASHIGRSWFAIAGASSFLAASAVMSLQPPLWVVLSVPFLTGAGTAVLETCLTAYAARRSSNPALLNYLHALFGFGAFVAPLLATALLDADLGWSSIYLTLVAVSLTLVAGFVATFPHWQLSDAEKTPPADVSNAGATGGNSALAALRIRMVWLMGLFCFLYVGAEVSVGHWSFSLLSEERHLGAGLASGLSSGYWLGLAIARVVLAPLTAMFDGKHLVRVCLGGLCLGVGLYWLDWSETATGAGLLLMGFSLGPIFPTAIALMADRVPTRLVLSAVSVCAVSGNLGKAFCPWIAGTLTDTLGLGALLPYIAGLVGLTVVLWQTLSLWSRLRLPVGWSDEDGGGEAIALGATGAGSG